MASSFAVPYVLGFAATVGDKTIGTNHGHIDCHCDEQIVTVMNILPFDMFGADRQHDDH